MYVRVARDYILVTISTNISPQQWLISQQPLQYFQFLASIHEAQILAWGSLLHAQLISYHSHQHCSIATNNFLSNHTWFSVFNIFQIGTHARLQKTTMHTTWLHISCPSHQYFPLGVPLATITSLSVFWLSTDCCLKMSIIPNSLQHIGYHRN